MDGGRLSATLIGDRAALIQVLSAEAAKVSNRIAPEHLEFVRCYPSRSVTSAIRELIFMAVTAESWGLCAAHHVWPTSARAFSSLRCLHSKRSSLLISAKVRP